jgi:hypothetical protein
MHEKSFFDETMELLDECPLSPAVLADVSGVNKWTLAKIRQRVHENPGVRNVEKIRAALIKAKQAGWQIPESGEAA